MIDLFCFYLCKYLSVIYVLFEIFGGDDVSECVRVFVDGVKVNTSGLNNIFEIFILFVGIRNVNIDVV